MEMIVLLLLGLVIAGIFVLAWLITTRKATLDPVLVQRIDAVESALDRFEVTLKQEFRASREETGVLQRENRTELLANLADFRKEMNDVLKSIADQSLKQQKDVAKEQQEKLTELKAEQQKLTDKTVENLAKVTDKVESKLLQLQEQAKTDAFLLRETTEKALDKFSTTVEKALQIFGENQQNKLEALDKRQAELVEGTEKKLESIRITVEEKLEKTLSDRLGQSFEQVSKNLSEVQKGLGEMQALAQDVGGLKRALTNVKMRGGIGEVQLQALMEQMLTPEQYAANISTVPGSTERVEFAIKLPGKDDNGGQVWLPIDAKFPKDVYEKLQEAYEYGDVGQIDIAQKQLDATIKKMAKDIAEKYVSAPHTTDFGILFLPFEGIFAEVVRRSALLEELQRNYKIIIAGPTTLAAILHSLQMGFKTLAIQKRSSEVWTVLGEVKSEFQKFGGMLEKAKNNIQVGLNQLDEVGGIRTRAIERKLKNVAILPAGSDADSNLLHQLDQDEE